MLNEKLKDFYELFEHFVSGEWIYESKKIYEFLAQMSPKDIENFYIDPKTFDWESQTYKYGFGVEHFMNKQDIYELSNGEHMALLKKNKFRNFDSLRRVLFENQIISQDTETIRKQATASSFVQGYINKELAKIQKDNPSAFEKKRDSLNREVTKYISSIEAQISPAYIKMAMLLFLKFWDNAFSQIIVNLAQLNKIQKLMKSQTANMILIPTNRSFLDLWLLSFVH
jgi:hypothetical protein